MKKSRLVVCIMLSVLCMTTVGGKNHDDDDWGGDYGKPNISTYQAEGFILNEDILYPNTTYHFGYPMRLLTVQIVTSGFSERTKQVN